MARSVTMTSANPYADASTAYWNAGWRGVLPLPFRRKKTPPGGTTGYDGTDPSYADIVTWAGDGGQNICLRMPEGVIGIDVDDYDGKVGGQTLVDLVDRFGALPPTWMSTNRDDGISGIRLFRVPPGTKVLDEIEGGGIEFIQRHHRYLVCWPSLHPEGREYVWINEMTGETGSGVPTLADIPDLPQRWIDGLRDETERSVKAILDSGQAIAILAGFKAGDPCEHVIAHAAKAAVEGGSRHDAYNGAVLAVARDGRNGCPGAMAQIVSLHNDFIAAVTNPAKSSPRTKAEAENEWRRCLAGAVAIVAGDPQGDGCPDVVITDWIDANAEPAAPSDSPEVERTSWWPRDLTGVLNGNDPEPEPEYLMRLDGKALFYRGKVNGLIGESESGKTWVALLCVMQALRGGISVAYLDFEDTAPGIISRLRSMGASDDDLHYLTYIGPDETLGTAARVDLAEAIAKWAPELIILDGFNAAMTLLGLELTDNTDATKFSQTLLKPLARTGACLVYVDHVPKNKDQRAKGGIGAQAKRSMTTGCALAVDVVSAFGRGMTGRLRLTVDKDRPGHVRAIAVEAQHVGEAILTSLSTGEVTVEIERTATKEEMGGAQEREMRTQIMRVIASHGDNGAFRKNIADGMGKKPERVKEHIDWLISHGQILAEGRVLNGNRAFIINPDPDQLMWDLQ
jgi:hypothetical protein